jgi:hypothetical protein
VPAIVPFLPYIAGGASFLGGLVGNKSKATSTSTPTFDPSFSPLKDTILKMTMSRLNTDPNLAGYQAGGIRDINRVFGNVAQGENNNLTTRGLATSPVAATVDATRENARAGQVASFENSIPMLARQLKAEDLAAASGFLNMGRGQTTTGTQTSGGGLGGGIEQLAQFLGYASGKGAFGKPGGTGTDINGGGFTPSTTGVPLLPFGAGPRTAGSWTAPMSYQPQGFAGWG